jgi:hypothetical protein
MPPKRRNPPRAVKSRRAKRSQSDTITMTVNETMRVMGNPAVLMLMVVVAYLAITHHKDPTASWIKHMVSHMSATDSLKPLGTWVDKHHNQTVGIVAYSLTAFAVGPRDQKGLWLMGAVAAGYLVPQSSPWQVVYQSCAATLYAKTSRRDVKFLILLAVGALYALGWMGPGKITTK